MGNGTLPKGFVPDQAPDQSLPKGFKPDQPLKKKEPSQAVAKIGGVAGTSVLQSASEDKQRLASYLQETKPSIKTEKPAWFSKEYEVPQTDVSGVILPATKPEHSQSKVDKKAYNTLMDVAYSDEDWNDPIKGLAKKTQASPLDEETLLVNDRANRLVEQSLAPDGYEAKRLLADQVYANAGADNLTANMIRGKADRYDRAVSDFRNVDLEGHPQIREDELDNAAIRSYAKLNPHFEAQLKGMNIDINDPRLSYKIGDGLAGSIINQVLNNEDIRAFAEKENPKIVPYLQQQANTLRTKRLEWGESQIGNELSRAIQESGVTNPIANFDTQNRREFFNSLAQDLYKNDPESLKLWNDRKDWIIEHYVDDPSLLERFGSAGKQYFGGFADAFKLPSVAESIKNQLNKEATAVNAETKGAMRFWSGTGTALGTFASIAAGGEILGLVKGANAANTLSMVIPMISDARDIANAKYPNNPLLAGLSTTINVGYMAALGYKNLLPIKQVQALFKNAEPELAKVAEGLSSKSITLEAAKQQANNIVKKSINVLGKAINTNTKLSLELAAAPVIDRTFDIAAGLDKTVIDKYDQNPGDVGTNMFIDNAALSLLIGYGGVNARNKMLESHLYEASIAPKRLKSVAEEMALKNPELKLDEIKSNIDFVSNLAQTLRERGVSEKNIPRYLSEAVQSKVKSERLKASPESGVKRANELDIKRHDEIMDAILKGEDAEKVVTEDEKKAASDSNKLYEKGKSAVQKLLDEVDAEGKPVFKGEGRDAAKKDPEAFLRQVADQVFGYERVNDKRIASETAPPDEKVLVDKYTADVVNAAKEMFPDKGDEASVADVKAAMKPKPADQLFPEGNEVPTEQKAEGVEPIAPESGVKDGKKVYHGTSHVGELNKETDGIIWFTDNKKVADQYRKRNVFNNEMDWDKFEGDVQEVSESGSAIDVVANEMGIDLNKGSVIEGDINPKKPLNLTDFEVNVNDVGELWDALHKQKLIDDKWEDIDPEVQQEIKDDYKGKAIWNLLENEGVYDKAKKLGYDAVVINDVGVDGKPHISYGLFGAKEFKPKTAENETIPQTSTENKQGNKPAEETGEPNKPTTEVGKETEGQQAAEPPVAEPPANEPPTGAPGVNVPKEINLTPEGITHAANEVRRKERELPEYERTPESFEQWNSEAEQKLKDGYDVDDLISRIEKGHDPTPVENAIRKIYVATLDAEILKNPTDELLAKQKRFIQAGDLANSRAGRNLVSLKGVGSAFETISDFYVAKMESSGVDRLTENQKEEVKKQFEEIKNRAENAEKKVTEMEAKLAEMEAQKELNRQRGNTKKTKTHEERVKDRKAAVEAAREALKKIRTGESGISSVSIPGVKELIAIAPHVKKVVESYLGEGIDNLKEIVGKVYDEFKDLGLTEKNVHDIIAGNYSERKYTRGEIAKQMQDLKTEAGLLNKLDEVLKGEEPKSEKAKIERNRKITELRKKIKEVQDVHKELEKTAENAADAKAKLSKEAKSELDKAEKEIEDKERKDFENKKKEAEAEAKRLEKELAAAKEREEKRRIKEALAEQKRLEKELNKQDPDLKRIEQAKERNKKRTEELNQKIKNKDFTDKPKKVTIYQNAELKKKYPQEYKEMIDALVAKEDAQHNFDLALLRDRERKMTKLEQGGKFVKMFVATTKALKAGIDFSGTFVQSFQSLFANPKVWAKAQGEAFRQLKSESAYRRYLTELHANEDVWKLMEESGLAVTDPASLRQENREEAFSNSALDNTFKIKGKSYNLGRYTTKPFERHYTALGNFIRVNLFLRESEKLMNEGKTFENAPEEYKAAAARANNLTGRGKLHKNVESASELVTLGIWSPRLMASRLNALGFSDLASPLTGKGYYKGLTPRQRRLAFYDVTKMIGSGIALMAAYGFMGGTAVFNPESPMFGTIKIGNYSVNVFDGFSKYVKSIVQGFTGHKRKNGERVEQNRWQTLDKFFRGSLTPAAATIRDVLSKKDYSGKPITWEGELKNISEPMAVEGMANSLRRDGMIGLLPGFANVFGLNVSDERDFDLSEKTTTLTDPETFIKRQATPEEYKKIKDLTESKESELLKSYENGDETIYVDVNGDAHITPADNIRLSMTWNETPYDKLNDKQKKKVKTEIKKKAFRESKKELYNDIEIDEVPQEKED